MSHFFGLIQGSFPTSSHSVIDESELLIHLLTVLEHLVFPQEHSAQVFLEPITGGEDLAEGKI